jgi:chromosome segregation ATPase
MTDEPENLVLVYLRRMDQRQERMEQHLVEIRARVSDLSRSAGLRRELASDAENVSHIQAQLDRLRDEMERVKRRLDITQG